MSKVMRTHTGITEWNGDFWCDSCGKRVRGITTVNGMDFCAKCYQETFGETDKDRKIADLQSQLAEKNKERNQKALEQLEKVKGNINKLPITDITDYGGFKKIYQADATRIIDQQINELKGER